MDIAGSALYCIGQYEVHEFDDGSFVCRSFEIGELHLGFLGLQFNVGLTQFGHRLHDLLKVFLIAAAVRFLNAFLDRTLRCHHRFDIETGHELDIVHGEDVGRIDHGDSQRCTHPAQWQNLVALGSLKRDQLYNGRINFKI